MQSLPTQTPTISPENDTDGIQERLKKMQMYHSSGLNGNRNYLANRAKKSIGVLVPWVTKTNVEKEGFFLQKKRSMRYSFSKRRQDVHQYSNSSDTSVIDPRMSPLRIRPGSICAATILRTITFRDAGPQPSMAPLSASRRHPEKKNGIN